MALVFLSNNFECKPTDIAALYKHRWKIKLLSKWIKQQLKIKSFWGTSTSTVKIQIWIAICTHIIVAIAIKRFRLKQTLYEISQMMSINLFVKSPTENLFNKTIQQNVKELFPSNQLNVFEKYQKASEVNKIQGTDIIRMEYAKFREYLNSEISIT